jgi:CheY-like chemotaxis protein
MDDEAMVRDLLNKLLRKLGYEAELVQDGTEALEHYQKAKEAGQPFDLVIMDLTIPGGMGGKEAIKKLLELNPEAKAIVSSGYSYDPVMANWTEYGFKGVISKPYDLATLEQALGKVLK